MDMFHDNPVLQSVRQMLGAFARQMMRPIAIRHDQEESMPWDLMKAAQSSACRRPPRSMAAAG